MTKIKETQIKSTEKTRKRIDVLDKGCVVAVENIYRYEKFLCQAKFLLKVASNISSQVILTMLYDSVSDNLQLWGTYSPKTLYSG